MENALKFLKSFSVIQFIKMAEGDKIKVIKSPKSGKFFFTCGELSGKVSEKVIAAPAEAEVEIADAIDEKTGEKFYILCLANAANVVREYK